MKQDNWLIWVASFIVGLLVGIVSQFIVDATELLIGFFRRLYHRRDRSHF